MIDSEPSLPNEENDKWAFVKHTRILHRKTYIKGSFISKYYGELDYNKELQGFVKEKYFDFTLYEAEINNSRFRVNNEGPFTEFSSEEIFIGKIQPNPLPCKISYNDISGEFEIILYDVKLANIDFNKHRALHQDEDNQVFGTVEAEITGYILEEFIEEYEVKVKLEETNVVDSTLGSTTFLDSNSTITPYKTNIKTGKTKTEGQYSWDEFWFSDKKTTYWGNAKFIGKTETGCLSSIYQIIGFILVIFFLAAIGPQAIIAILVIIGVFLIISYISEIIKWLFKISAVLMILFFLINIISALKKNKPIATTIPEVKDDLTEIKIIKPDTTNITDSLIVHHRIWRDYEGKQYEGNIWVKLTDFRQSNRFKDNLNIRSNTIYAYDKVLLDLKKQDDAKMGGVYALLDSIKTKNNQSDIQFAETVVSFVQDMPYAIVLDKACDPSLYEDIFTKSYLKSSQANCDGFQKFGINSPVEFIGTLKGDCDTRTLLLYTLFSHYKYEVAILSSEIYSHSILAINLPLSGKAIIMNNKRFVVWETTAPNTRAGLLPEDISNFNNWRISLLSKQ